MVPDFSSSSAFIPENAEIRSIYTGLLFAPLNEVKNAPERIHVQTSSSTRVLFQIKEQNDHLYFLFTNEEEYKFPLYSSGSYIIKRSKIDGSFVQIKIFIRSDKDTFLRIFPYKDRSKMDVYLQGYPVYKNVNIPLSFNSLLFLPFSRIKDATKSSINWDLIEAPEPDSGYNRIEKMIAEIRKSLPFLKDADDGAIDWDGSYRYIKDLSLQENGGLNCSGFAKWIVDGIYYQSNREYLKIEDLKEKAYSLRGNSWNNRFEDERDPYFGLDWIRNLAASVHQNTDYEGFDVRDVPFLTYIEDVGYPVEYLKLILYILAQKEAGNFYLGSVNKEYGSSPMLRQHYHIVSFFPYFDSKGDFKVAIFERNKESYIDSFIKSHQNDYIHLVRIEAPSEYHTGMMN